MTPTGIWVFTPYGKGEVSISAAYCSIARRAEGACCWMNLMRPCLPEADDATLDRPVDSLQYMYHIP